MITEDKLTDLGYVFTSRNELKRLASNFYSIEGRKYDVNLTDDGILTVLFPFNYKPLVKGIVNVTDWNTFLDWHNNYIE